MIVDPPKISADNPKMSVGSPQNSVDPPKKNVDPPISNVDPPKKNVDPNQNSVDLNQNNVDINQNSADPPKLSGDPPKKSADPPHSAEVETECETGLFKKLKEKVVKIINFIKPPRQNFVDESQKIKEIRYQGKMYNVSGWIKNHPGGRVIEFYTKSDEDATEAINQFHHRSSERVMKLLKVFKSRPLDQKEEEGGKKYEQLSEDFDKLTLELQEEGLFEPSWGQVAFRLLEIVILCAISVLIAFFVENIYIATACCTLVLSIFMLRAIFLVHEAGHYSITGSVKADRIITTVVGGFCIGFSGSWWRSHHSRHHAMPQRLERDVNINSMPFLAYSVEGVKGVKRSERFPYSFILKHQAILFTPFMAVSGYLGWKLWCCPIGAWRKGQYHELFIMALHYTVLPYFVGVFPFILATIITANSILITFDTSHSHLPVWDGPQHWVEYGLVNTLNLETNWFWDWWTGSVNFQIEHHLFPTMPNFQLKKAAERVKQLAEKHNLPYVVLSYGKAVQLIYQNLYKVSSEVITLRKGTV